MVVPESAGRGEPIKKRAGPVDAVVRAYPPHRKIEVIKVIRELMGLGLKESKDLSESLPATVLREVPLEAGEQVQREFGEGVDVELRRTIP